ncbi:MAG: hypothetical protein HYZ16_02120 [Bacteroidetes bacterium]|nr:hypothetical protein [Bacteroidota bacterium]
MHNKLTIGIIAMCMAMLVPHGAQAQLSGNYTINPSGSGTSNYRNITDAVKDLTSKGVSGPVNFAMSDGVYREKIYVSSAISGASSTNTITFTGNASDSNLVTVFDTSGTVEIYSADYLNFKYIRFKGDSSYQNVVISNGANYNKFYNCNIIGAVGGKYAFNVSIERSEYNSFNNCRLVGGYYNVYLYGSGTGSSASKGNEFNHCTLVKHMYYGFYSQYMSDTKLWYNLIDSAQYNGYPIMNYYCQRSNFNGNEAYGGYYGFYCYYENQYGSSTDSSTLVNNIFGNSLYYGAYCYYAPRTKFFHNVFEGGDGNYSLILYYSAGVRFANNILACDGAYYGFMCYYTSTSDAPGLWDYNDYYFNNYTYFSYFGTSLLASLSALKSNFTAYNQNCVEVDPNFTSSKNLRTTAPGLNNIGYPVGVNQDIDGNPRPNKNDAPKVDIGPNDFYLAPYDLDVYALVSPLSVNLTKNTITAQFRN